METIRLDSSHEVDVLPPEEGGHRWLTKRESYRRDWGMSLDDDSPALIEVTDYHDGPRCADCGMHFCRNCEPGQWLSRCPKASV